MIKIWNNAPKIKNVKNPNGLVYCITKNFCLNMLKKKKAHALPDSIANTVAHKTNCIQIEEANIQFKQMISCLNEKEQQIVILKIMVGYTFKEIAKEMKIKQNSVVKNYYKSFLSVDLLLSLVFFVLYINQLKIFFVHLLNYKYL